MGNGRVDGWMLDEQARAELLERFWPRYGRIVADHVTFKPGPGMEQRPEAEECLLVGRADDGEGVEAMVVSIGGSTQRPDGSTWHITWSLGESRHARESNDVIAAHGWQAFPEALRVPLRPASWS